MSDEREPDVEEPGGDTAAALPERQALSPAGSSDGIVHIGFDRPRLPPELDGYDPPPDDAA